MIYCVLIIKDSQLMRVDNEHAAGVVFSAERALWECDD
jgi:hypothetical protein